jgi:peptide/nickel transport system substrate-binding protein
MADRVDRNDSRREKSLLEQAGDEDLTVDLVTADFAAGVTQAVQIFAQQATAAGLRST